MLNNLKALLVVATIAALIFVIAKPFCLRFMAESDFVRRRNIWFALTLIAFISPSFWLFALVALPVLVWSSRKDSNTVAFYVLILHVIPPVGMDIPGVIVNEIFRFNIYRIVSLAVLVPAAWRLLQSKDNTRPAKLTSMDVFFLAFGALTLVLFMPYESITNTMRRGFLYTIDVLVLYYVVSRICVNRGAIVETMASFVLVCAIYAPLALFESLKGWLLYGGLGDLWGNALKWGWMFRGDLLRAQVSAGHSIPLGFMIAVAFGFWLYLSSRIRSATLTYSVAALLWVGLLVAHARSPWLVATFVFFAYFALDPNGPARFFKSLFISALLAGIVLVSPVGERVIDNLPFVGTIGADSVVYRERVAEVSWELIHKNPWFGDAFVLEQMESLRQGQGIIDPMNAYAVTTLYYGVVGLFLFLGPFLLGVWNAYWLVRSSARSDPDLSLLGTNLIACTLGSLLMMGTGVFGGGFEKTSLVLVGLLAGFVQLGQVKNIAPSPGFYDNHIRKPVRH